VTQTHNPLLILMKRRSHALRRAETVGKAVDRLESTKEYQNVRKRYRNYLQTVANLTLAIDTLRQAEGKEVRALGQ
jgi:hypothetical protein